MVRSGQRDQAEEILDAVLKFGLSIDMSLGRWYTSDGREGTLDPFTSDVSGGGEQQPSQAQP